MSLNQPVQRIAIVGTGVHVGDGQGGIQHFMEHLTDPLAGMMKTLGTPEISESRRRRPLNPRTNSLI